MNLLDLENVKRNVHSKNKPPISGIHSRFVSDTINYTKFKVM